MWVLWFMACIGDGPSVDTGGDTASFGSAGMEGGGDATGWMPLSTDAHWVSNHDGYGTGGGFADIDGDGDPDLVVAHGNDMMQGHLVVF